MKIRSRWSIVVAMTMVAHGCGDDGNTGSSSEGSSSTGTSTGGVGPGTTGGSGSTDSSGGAMSASASGDSTGAASSTGGDTTTTGGMATCPGTADGCVVDWAGQFGVPGDADGVGGAAQFTNLAGITSDDTYVYVSANSAIRRIDKATATVETWAGTSGQTMHADDVGTAARFFNVAGLTTDGTTIWAADPGNNVIREIDIATATVTTIAGQVGNAGSNDGMAGTFEAMRDIAWDGTFLYLIQGNGVLRQIDPSNGDIDTVAGQPNTNAFADGVGNMVRFDVPRHIEVVAPGELYIADTENHRVRHAMVAGGVGTVTTVYGMTQGYMDGNGTAAQFDRHRGLAWDGGDILAVADADNFVIRAADLTTDDVTTIAGMAGVNTHAEGIGLAAGFDKPLDMHYDAATGDLFISEGSVLRRMYWQ